MTTCSALDRRAFFQRLGGGVVVLLAAHPLCSFAKESAPLYPEDFNAYLLIKSDGRVSVFSGKIEMGQGVLTSQAQMVAEELGVELGAIDMVLGDTDRCPWDMGTFGSMTTRIFGPALRLAAAEARQVLLSLAAQRLGVPSHRLLVSKGSISVSGDAARSVGFGTLSHGARIARIIEPPAVLRRSADFGVMGRSVQRLDAVEKVSGAAKYSADLRIAGMLYARVLRPPMHGATLVSADMSAARQVTGSVVVEHEGLIATLHTDPEQAADALTRIKAAWTLAPALLTPDSIFSHLISKAPAAKDIARNGDPDKARKASSQLFESSYQKGYVAHAAMEPHAALAEMKDGRLTVWASTQTPFPTRDRVAKALALTVAQVRVITPLLGGGFGGKSADLQAVEAARLAQITGRAVQVAWTREEEFFNDTFDPASVVQVTSACDADGNITLWDYLVIAAGERAALACYRFPNAWIRSAGKTSYGQGDEDNSLHPFAVGPWRGPGANMNVFAIESQIDVMASAAGIDPLAFRLRNLDDARMRRVLLAAAEKFGWKAMAGPSGRGFGMACVIDAGTYVATMAEVAVDASSGRIKVLRMVCAQDMGQVVNPEGARMQIEGGLTMGLGYTLSEELQFLGGEVLDRNFDSYLIPKVGDVPRVDVVLVSDDDVAPQGGGEPAITTTGAVIANAVFDATGVRQFRLPMLPARLRASLLGKPAIPRPA